MLLENIYVGLTNVLNNIEHNAVLGRIFINELGHNLNHIWQSVLEGLS